MNKVLTEAEVQARVEFKMNEFKTAMKNACAIKWNIAFASMGRKEQYYWEAFEEMNKMIDKEITMAPPHDRMDDRKKWEKKEAAIEEIKSILGEYLFSLHGHKRDTLIRQFVSIIQKAQ